VLVDQLRAIDNRRLLGGPLARLSRSLMASVSEALKEVLDSVD
jgi:mRNA-degrading endonuclease toxin of MazEF toxin-antitoxin module